MRKIKKNFFNRLSLNQKILTLIFIEIIAFISLMLVAFSQVYTVGSETKQMSSITIPLIESVHTIDASINTQRLSVIELYITVTQIINQNVEKTSFYDKYVQLLDGKVIQDRFLLASQKLKDSIGDTEDFIRKAKNQQTKNNDIILDNQERLLRELYDLRVVSQKYNQLVVSKLFLEKNLQILTLDIQDLNKISSIEDSLLFQADKVGKELENIIEASKAKIIYVERIAISYIVITTIISILFAITMILLIVRMNISKPLQLLTDSINRYTPLRKVTRLEDEQNILEREDELGRMGRSFNRLKEDLWEQGVGLQNAKEDADRANKAKSLFLASASHDLRQPLNAMQMYIAALKSKVKDDEILTIIEDINSVSASTARLLNALLDVSELEVGAIKPQYEDFPINNIFTSIFQSFAPLAKDKNLQFRIVPSNIAVKSDPDLLERILGNYMSNAIRYTTSGSVMIGCRRRGNMVSIEVWDTGCGISEDQMPNIFDDFYQIENKERDRSKGLGLGLALAKRLSISLNHSIEFKSTFGSGSCFSVLVAIGEQKSSEVKLDVIPNIMDLTGAKVLLIEDDTDVLKATIQLLESWGCVVEAGRNQDEIKDIIRSPSFQLPDIIVADNRLPGASGIDVVKLVQQELGDIIPSVIVTGDVERSHIQSITEKGFQVLLKPIQPAKFRAILSHLINS